MNLTQKFTHFALLWWINFDIFSLFSSIHVLKHIVLQQPNSTNWKLLFCFVQTKTSISSFFRSTSSFSYCLFILRLSYGVVPIDVSSLTRRHHATRWAFELTDRAFPIQSVIVVIMFDDKLIVTLRLHRNSTANLLTCLRNEENQRKKVQDVVRLFITHVNRSKW